MPGPGTPANAASRFQNEFECSLRGVARLPGEPPEKVLFSAPAQPNRTALDCHSSDLQSVFLLPDEKVQNSTLHTLQTELRTESVRNWHHCELTGSVGEGHPNHHGSLLKNVDTHPLPLNVKSPSWLGYEQLCGIPVLVLWNVCEAFYFIFFLIRLYSSRRLQFCSSLFSLKGYITPLSLSRAHGLHTEELNCINIQIEVVIRAVRYPGIGTDL